jgi:enterochelin esterase family protein
MKSIQLFLLLMLVGISLQAQPPRPAPTPNDTLNSTKILADGRVIFSIYAPKAVSVTLIGDFLKEYKPINLVKNEVGVWSYTSDVLTPELYSYDFTVDGVKTLDPKNSLITEGLNGYNNCFEMPGKAFDYCAIKEVPHGNLQKVWYFSKVTGKTTRFHVYTPPGYENSKEKLPVLYLQHGGGDNDASWSGIGRANFIMDNLYAEKKAVPMIIVMPMGNPARKFYANPGIDEDPYYKQVFDEIMPLVAQKFRVLTDRYHTAYAGLSMGGLQAMNMAIFSPQRFGYVLPLSTGFFPPQIKMLEEKYADALRNPEINKLKLFWICMGGTKDIAYQNGLNNNTVFDKFGIKYQKANYDAGHTYITWRHNLAEFAPMLFK